MHFSFRDLHRSFPLPEQKGIYDQVVGVVIREFLTIYPCVRELLGHRTRATKYLPFYGCFPTIALTSVGDPFCDLILRAMSAAFPNRSTGRN